MVGVSKGRASSVPSHGISMDENLNYGFFFKHGW
jgi:hypothetical protein